MLGESAYVRAFSRAACGVISNVVDAGEKYWVILFLLFSGTPFPSEQDACLHARPEG